jgi:hypothetical protein
MQDFDSLAKKMEEFKPYLGENGFLYTYIAPKEKEKFYKFLGTIYNSSAAHSLYLRLSDPQVVKKMLDDLGFLDNTELEIYISINDQKASQWMCKTLKKYIEEHGLDFNY